MFPACAGNIFLDVIGQSVPLFAQGFLNLVGT